MSKDWRCTECGKYKDRDDMKTADLCQACDDSWKAVLQRPEGVITDRFGFPMREKLHSDGSWSASGPVDKELGPIVMQSRDEQCPHCTSTIEIESTSAQWRLCHGCGHEWDTRPDLTESASTKMFEERLVERSKGSQMTQDEVRAFIEAEPEFPGPMPWKWRWMFLRMILAGEWAEYHRLLVKVTKASMIRRLGK